VKAAARKRSEILMPAFEVRASDTGDALPAIAAGEEAFRNTEEEVRMAGSEHGLTCGSYIKGVTPDSEMGWKKFHGAV
jgi:hypothetical protein